MGDELPFFGIDLGGPYTGTIYQDRLVLAGAASTSDLVVASKIGDWNDFRQSTRTVESPQQGESGILTTLEDAFWFQQTSSRTNTYHSLLQQEGLFIFGDLGEAVIPRGRFSAEDVRVNENSWYGTDIGRPALIVSGLVVFIQSGGRDIRGFNWNEVERKYIAPSLLDRSGAIIDGARDMTFAPSEGRRADTVFVVAGDGRAGVMSLRHDAPHYAWNLWETGPGTRTEEGDSKEPVHKILGVAAPLGNLVAIVQRDNQVFLETLNRDEGALCDGFHWTQEDIEGRDIPAAPSRWEPSAGLVAVIRAPGPESGREIRTMVTDVTVQDGRFVVMRDGELTTDLFPERTETNLLAPEETLEIGYAYGRVVETLPFIAPSQSGSRRSVTKSRILDVAVDFAADAEPQTVTLGVGGRTRRILSREEGGRTAGEQIKKRRFGGQAGWKYRAAVRLEFNEPVEIAGIATKAVG